MSVEKNLYELIQKCDICLNGEVISRELLLKTYAQFISETICSDKHEVGVSLHTGSICFDLITIVYAALSCLLYDQTPPEDIVNSLKEGDLIWLIPFGDLFITLWYPVIALSNRFVKNKTWK